MPQTKLVTQTSRKPSGNLALQDSLTFSLLAKLNSLPSFFVTRVRSTSLLLHRLYKECKTTPNYFSPTPTSHGEGGREREGVKEEKTSTTSDSLALDVTFKPMNYQKKTSEGRLDGWEAKWTFLSMWITYVSWLHPQLGMWQQFENATALCLPCGKTPIEKPLWILNGLLALCE